MLNEEGFTDKVLSVVSAAVFKELPLFVKKELLLERESSGKT